MGKVLGPMLGYGADCDEFHQEAAKGEQERQLEIEKENCQLPTSWEPILGKRPVAMVFTCRKEARNGRPP